MRSHKRIKLTVVDGVEITEVDFSNAPEAEYIEVQKILREAAQVASRTLYFAIDVHKLPTSIKSIEAAKKSMINHQVSTSVSAIYGASAFQRTITKAINYAKSNGLKVFDSKDEAIQFLVSKGLENSKSEQKDS